MAVMCKTLAASGDEESGEERRPVWGLRTRFAGGKKFTGRGILREEHCCYNLNTQILCFVLALKSCLRPRGSRLLQGTLRRATHKGRFTSQRATPFSAHNMIGRNNNYKAILLVYLLITRIRIKLDASRIYLVSLSNQLLVFLVFLFIFQPSLRPTVLRRS